MRSCGEFFVDALKKDVKYGVIASSDMHTGRPGYALKERCGKLIYSGLMGVWADKLDRESVFEAI